MKPQLLILDDPTQGLNQRSIEVLVDLIEEKMKSGELKHVFLSTENPVLIEGLEHKDLVFQDQKIIDFEEIYLQALSGEKAG